MDGTGDNATLAHARGWRERWQWPTFLAGLLALTVAIASRPGRTSTAEDNLRRQVVEVIALMDRGEFGAARPRLNALAQAVEAYPSVAGDVHLALGLAKAGAESPASEPPTRSSLLGARRHFRQAEQHGVSPSLSPRLRYVLAKTALLLSPTDDDAYAAFQAALDQYSGDALDGLRVLAEVQEARGQFDHAVRTTERLLTQPTLTNPNPVRLRRGLLLARLERHEEARLTLERIPRSAPEHPRALAALARSYHDEGKWDQAARHWEACLDLPALSGERPRHLFMLAECHARLNRRIDAVKLWETLSREHGRTPEALPARLQLADHYFRAGDDESCRRAWVQILENLSTGFTNPYVDLAALRRTVADAWTRSQSQGRHELALAIARLYREVGLPGEADRMEGEVHRDVARLSLSVSPITADKAAMARTRFIDAAEAFTRAADGRIEPTEQAILLWESADCYLKAQAYEPAAKALERYLALGVATQHDDEVRLGLGEANQALKRSEAAEVTLRDLAAKPGPCQPRARYLLALALLDQDQVENAEELLRAILAAPAAAMTDDAPRLALDALIHVLFRRERFADAAKVLEQYLSRSVAEATSANHRYWLAQSHARAAREELRNVSAAETQAAKEFYLRVRREHLESAVRHFQHLISSLSSEGVTAGAIEAELLREGRFGLGEGLFHLGRHEEALAVYSSLVQDCTAAALKLKALAWTAQAQFALERREEARQTVERARQLFLQLTDQEVESSRLSRAQWESWLLKLESAVLATSSKN